MKKYSVDIHCTIAKNVVVEAKTREDAEKQIWDKIQSGKVCVWTDGFEATDDVEVNCVGEENDEGNIKYD